MQVIFLYHKTQHQFQGLHVGTWHESWASELYKHEPSHAVRVVAIHHLCRLYCYGIRQEEA